MVALGYVFGEYNRRWTSAREVRMQTLAGSLCRVPGRGALPFPLLFVLLYWGVNTSTKPKLHLM